MGTPQSGRRGEHLSTPRIVYFGSGAFAVPPLERLHAAGYPIPAVVSQPPKPAGRGMRLQPTPVHRLAESLGLPVLTPARARDPEFLAQSARPRARPDCVGVLRQDSAASPRWRLPRWATGTCTARCLPKYRGASPIQYALLNGERETGVTLMEMVAEMDAGDIYLQAVEPITPTTTTGRWRRDWRSGRRACCWKGWSACKQARLPARPKTMRQRPTRP
jgi:methionyl-tRNA formyltransferase